MTRGFIGSALAAFLLLNLVGCNTSGLSPVEGVLKLDGVPLANASIQFIPQGTGRDATAGTNANGEFVMSTNQPRDGVMAGTYKVVITPPRTQARRRSLLPPMRQWRRRRKRDQCLRILPSR